MIFELTRDYSIIVPLMISNLISFFISQRLQPEPIYEALALQEGVFLPTGESRQELSGMRVGEVMQPGPAPLTADTDVAAARIQLDELGRNAWPVGDSGGLFGIVTARQMEAGGNEARTLREIVGSNAKFPYVHPDHSVSRALERMGAAGMDALPVVSRGNLRQICGVVTLPGILAAYGMRHDSASVR